MNENLLQKKNKTWSLKRLFVFLVPLFLVLPVYSQITINIQNVPLRQALGEIEKVSDYRFFYSESLTVLNHKCSLRVTDASIDAVMRELLAGTNVTYEKNNLIIALIEKGVKNQKSKIVVRGRIADTQDEPVVGANIIEEGASGNGTISNADGAFTLEVNQGAILKISYLGYRDVMLRTAGKTSFEVVLEEDTKALGEVVVTALGIKREEKALGYAVQKIDGESLQKVSGVDVSTSLTGKIAGLLVRNPTDFNVVQSITIRGEEPLLVIDGVAYANKTLRDISSEDIESINVLKGATASALYGFRGSNGAILITTKNGSSGKIGVTVDFTTNTLFSSGYLAVPEKQSVYGRGKDNAYDKNSTESWGTFMDGSIKNQWDPFLKEYRDYEYLPVGKNNFKNFLEKGYITNNNVNVSFKGKEIALRSSVNWTQNKGLYPNSRLNKYSYTLGGDIQLGKFQLSSNMSYAKRESPNMGFNSYKGYDPMYSLLINSSADFNILDYKNNYWLKEGEIQNYTYRSQVNNPYFDSYEKTNEVSRDIFNADLSASYQIAEWLKATVRSGLDFYIDRGKLRVSRGSFVSTGDTGIPGNPYTWNGTKTGAYLTGRTQGFSMNNDFLLTGNRTVFDRLEVDYLAGGTIFYRRDDNINAQTDGGIFAPGFFSLKASVKPPKIGESMHEQQVNSLFGRLALAWNKMIYAEVTGRNDWSSTLAGPHVPKSDMSYFYPSVSGSFVVSELLPESTRTWLDLLKIRSSWTQSKTPAAIYAINQGFSVTTGTWNNMNGASAPHTIYPASVRPNASQTYEVGVQGIFLKNRLSVDVSYYDKNMYDFLKNASISPASGMTNIFVNLDERISRRGWEVSVTATPVKTQEWQWDMAFNWSTYKRVYTQLDSVYSTKKPWIKKGERVDAYVANDFMKVPGTNDYIYHNGRLQKSKYQSVMGYSDPDWLWGFHTTLRYKDFSLFLSFDGVVGGLMGTRTESYMWQMGVHPQSVTPERAKDVENPGSLNYLGQGVKVVSGKVTFDTDGNITSDTRTYAPNDVYTTYKQAMQDLHASSAWGGSASPADIYSKTFIKLREVSLTYHVPRLFLEKWGPVKNASISFIGQNVFLWAKDFKYSDPDGGNEDFADPSVRYLGANIKLTF